MEQASYQQLPARLGEAIDTQGSWAATERGLERLEIWVNRNLLNFKKNECKALPLRRNNFMFQRRSESGFEEDSLWVVVYKILSLR